MATKIIIKENGLSGTTNTPSGYKFIGDSLGTISQKLGATVSSIGGVSEYTETIVNISSAQILAMGTTPIELLPAPGAGIYYDIDKIILEYTHNTTPYSITSDFIFIAMLGNININTSFLQGTSNYVYVTRWSTYFDINDGGFAVTPPSGINQNLRISTDGTVSGAGNGTLRVKIYHKTITFGS